MRDAALSERERIQIIRGEFLEIPGLRLTRDQVQRLWDLRRDTCATILEELLDQGFLRVTADGAYVRGGCYRGARSSPRIEPFHREIVVYAR